MSAKGIFGFERGVATPAKVDLTLTSIVRFVIWMASVHLQRSEGTVLIQDIYSIYSLFTIHSNSLCTYLH